MIGTLAHPLNLPVFDSDRGHVVDGYTILQPRVAVSLGGGKGQAHYRTCDLGHGYVNVNADYRT